MRVYRPQATKPIPPDAKVNQQRKTVKYKGRGGTERRAVLTDKGRMKVTCDTWHIEFRDALDRPRRIAAFDEEGDSRLLGTQIEELIKYAGQTLPVKVAAYFDDTPTMARIIERLREWGLLPEKQRPTPTEQPLAPLIDAYEAWMRTSKGKSGYRRNDEYITGAVARIRNTVAACGFEVWADVTPAKVENHVGSLNLAPRTHNGYIGAIKRFAGWCRRNGHITENPLAEIGTVTQVQQDKRRPLDVVEVRALLAATLARGPRYHVGPMERASLYVVGLVTGFRRKELSWLTPECFDLDRAIVRLDGSHTKNHNEAVQPLPLALIDGLREFLSDRDQRTRIWHPLPNRTADMIREDGKAAGLRMTDSEGRILCFHSLRHSLRSWLVRAKVGEAVTDDILRHKPDTNNIGRRYYTHLDDSDRRTAIESLPSIPWPSTLKSQSLRQVYEAPSGHYTPSNHNSVEQGTDSDEPGLQAQKHTPKCTRSLVHPGLALRLDRPEVQQNHALRESDPNTPTTTKSEFTPDLRDRPETDVDWADAIPGWNDLPDATKAAIVETIRGAR